MNGHSRTCRYTRRLTSARHEACPALSGIDRKFWVQEYTGIDVLRLEQMESRLKADVLREAAAHGGKLLVAREVMGSKEGDSASIIDSHETINGQPSWLRAIRRTNSIAESGRRDHVQCRSAGGADSSGSV